MVNGQYIPVLAYHKVEAGFELGVNSITPQTFEHHIRFLAEQGYTAITVNQLIHSLSNKVNKHQLPPRSILITFDDGYENFYTSAYPILKKYGLTATVFLLAGYIGKPNTWDVRLSWRRPRHLSREQIQTLFKEGIEFASHGMFHRFLTDCNPTEVKVELEESKALLENLLQHPVHSFAYPYGNANAMVTKMAESAGYHIAFGLNPSQAFVVSGVNSKAMKSFIYCFPRIAIYRYDTTWSFLAKLGLLGAYRFRFECLKNRFINSFAYLNRLRS